MIEKVRTVATDGEGRYNIVDLPPGAYIVTFTLTPTASGTHLLLVQSGFRPEQKHNFGGARYGWRMMGGKLVDLLARIS